MNAEKLTAQHQPEQTGNLKIPLANGNIMNIPFSAINITEEVNKTGIWKQVNKHNVHQEKEKTKKNAKSTSRFKKKKHAKKEEKQREERGKLEKRLSTMAEEEEDEGITIKFEQVREKDYWKGQDKQDDSEETHV